MYILDAIFIVLAIVAVFSALLVITFRNAFRATVAFVMVVLSLAGIFVLLNADFLGAVQVLVNVGAVAILVIVMIMLVRDIAEGSPRRQIWLTALGSGVALLIFVAVLLATINGNWVYAATGLDGSQSFIFDGTEAHAALDNSVLSIGRVLLGDFLLVLEILGVLVAATVVASITLMRGVISDEPIEAETDYPQ